MVGNIVEIRQARPEEVWSERDALWIILSVALLFLVFVGVAVLAGLVFPEAGFGVAFTLTTANILAIGGPVLYLLWRKKISAEQFGLVWPGWLWLLLCMLLGTLVTFLGAYLSMLWSEVLGLNTEPIAEIFSQEESDNIWLTVLYFKVFVVLLIPVAEELFFRGVIFRYLRQRQTFLISATLSALFFAAVHLSLAAMPFLILLGLVTAWVFERSGSLLAPAVVHVVVNNMAVNLYLFNSLLQ